jgi:hypothetical protein
MKRKITLNPNLFVITRKVVKEEQVEEIAKAQFVQPSLLEPIDNTPNSTPLTLPATPIKTRQVKEHESLAFCAHCQKMVTLTWLPAAERGKRAEEWFQCEFCGSRELTLNYLSESEAVAKNQLAKAVANDMLKY